MSNTPPNFLEMSDEDILNMVPPSFEAPAAGEEEEEQAPAAAETAEGAATAATNEGDDDDDTASAAAAAGEDNDADAADDDAGTAGADPAAGPAAKGKEAGEAGTADKPAGEAAEDKKPEAGNTAAVDYEAEYKKIMAPFKANGRDIQVKSPEDAIALMQMGANYNKKMAALKPNLKLLKLLENNNLLDEQKISFLIDLDKKNPAAINKLIKDSGVDPLELDADKASEYKQTPYTVDDREIELDTVLDELKDSPAYNQVLSIVSNKWDGKSKQTIANHPGLLHILHTHVTSGVYDIIEAEIDNERMLGRLKGLSDIDAYQQVGDAIQARGGFNHLFASTEANKGQAAPAAAVEAPKPKADDGKLKDKRRAAGSTKPVAAAPASTKAFDPLALSDEEFAKLATPKYS